MSANNLDQNFRIAMIKTHEEVETDIGSYTLKISEMEGKGANQQYDLKTRQGKNAGGKINLNNFEVRDKPSFVEVLRSGVQLSLAIAIDFTASNGNT